MYLKPYFIKTPRWIKHLFNKQIWHVETTEKILFLTFDDGPIPEVTPWVLDELIKYNAKATFFCIADNVCKYPEIYKQISAHGHQVGNHTFSHINGWESNTKNYLKNTVKATNHIDSKLFRPPHGKIKPSQAKALRKQGYKIIMWDVLSADFDQSIKPNQCLDNVLKNAGKGSIIVFHDSLKAKDNLYDTLPKVLAYFSKQGYLFEKL
jgi:peptidoglycan/xylan/chitin deacetylase (PgdA/CDA1 family)